MLGNTITINNGAEKVLTLINQDGYSSEYLLKDTDSEYRLKIRHTKTKATATKPARDRHNVELRQTVYEDGDVPEFERLFYFVIENKVDDLSIANVDAMCDLAIASANAFLDSLMGWES